MDSELTMIDGFQQGTIVRSERMQSAHGSAVPLNPAFQSLGEFPQSGSVIDAGQGVGIAVQALLRHFRSTVQIGNSTAHGAPRRLTLGVSLLGTIDQKHLGPVDGTLQTQHSRIEGIKLVISLE